MHLNRAKHLIRLEAKARGIPHDIVPMLEQMSSERGVPPVAAGHLLVMLEEEANWQLQIYDKATCSEHEPVPALQEKIEALQYAVKLIEIAKVLMEAGVQPLYAPAEA